jgi:hypothetical protein
LVAQAEGAEKDLGLKKHGGVFMEEVVREDLFTCLSALDHFGYHDTLVHGELR